MRTCLRALSRAGYTETLDTIHADGKDRWEVWALDSVIFACECLESLDPIGALRGLAQAKEYTGRNGGFLPAYIADAIRSVQDELERAICRGGLITSARRYSERWDADGTVQP